MAALQYYGHVSRTIEDTDGLASLLEVVDSNGVEAIAFLIAHIIPMQQGWSMPCHVATDSKWALSTSKAMYNTTSNSEIATVSSYVCYISKWYADMTSDHIKSHVADNVEEVTPSGYGTNALTSLPKRA